MKFKRNDTITQGEKTYTVTDFLGEGGQVAGNTAFLGILDDGVQSGFQLSFANREGIDTAAVELAENGQSAVQECGLLTAPEEEVYK